MSEVGKKENNAASSKTNAVFCTFFTRVLSVDSINGINIL